MDIIHTILHLDIYLGDAVRIYHNYFYILLFLVIFCETGLVITPFLPGDSLLFVAGSIATNGNLNFGYLAGVIFLAAFLGDNSNFFIGKFLGEHLFKNPNSKIFRRDILLKTHDFYEHHGKKTVVLARFIPLIRTFAPFVAGLGHMPYTKFITFSFVGSFLWVTAFLGGGFLFGNLPIIKSHISLIIIVVMLISIIPVFKMIFDEIKLSKVNGK